MEPKRLQVLVETAQRIRLQQRAADRGVSVSALVRDAIDLVCTSHGDRRAAAAVDILETEPMPVGDPSALRAELDELRSGT